MAWWLLEEVDREGRGLGMSTIDICAGHYFRKFKAAARRVTSVLKTELYQQKFSSGFLEYQ